MKFENIGINKEVVKALKEMGIEEPTDIQEKTIPEILKGNDIIGISKTGSGKTFAFGTPVLDKIKNGQGIQLLVVVPVRELAEQVAKELRKCSKYLNPTIAVIYGGVSMDPQQHNLRKADIIVGTPGRLVDHLNRRNLNLSKIKVVVLDEADKMATMGFIEDVEELLRATPKSRQTLLFGATISEEIAKLRDRYMNKPQVIKSAAHVDETLLNQYYYDVEQKEKFSLLVHLIKKEKPKLGIVFCSTRRNTEVVAKNLQKYDIEAREVHGKMGQASRTKVIEGFHKGKPHILVATAVAARGLDIKNVTHVFNYDIPRNAEEYIHQVGRTARAGVTGKAISLLTQMDHANFSAVLRRYPVKVTKLPIEEFEKIKFDSGKGNQSYGHGGGFYRRDNRPRRDNRDNRNDRRFGRNDKPRVRYNL